MTAGTIPIIRLRGVLLVAIQVELSDRLVRDLRSDLGRELLRGDVRGVVLELSGVDTFDTYIARSIRDMAQMARLMGFRTVVTGLDAGIAITLVEMGMHLEGVPTTLTLESALDLLASKQTSSSDEDDLLFRGDAGLDDEEGLFDPQELEG
jgi:rsbT antagonist protein RsbS